MECEEFILPDWSTPDNLIQPERAKRASMGVGVGKDLVSNASDWLRRSNCGKLNIVKGITWVIYDALFNR